MNQGLIPDQWHEKLPPTCPECGYNLTGLTRNVCPECGKGIYWTDVRNNARQLYYAMLRIDDMNDLCDLAYYFASAATIIMLFFWAMNTAVGLARVIATLLAIAAVGSSVQVFRVRGAPEHAREILPHRPKYMKGAAGAFFGVAVILLGLYLP